jgi:hypothetical protein
MKVDSPHLIDRSGVSMASFLVASELGWLYRSQETSDMGIDAHFEVVLGGEATGRLLAVQIKSGLSWFREPTAGGWWYRCDARHMEYWRGCSLPVVVALFHPVSKAVHWQHVDETTLIATGKGWKILVPAAQQLIQRCAFALAGPAQRSPQTDVDLIQRQSVADLTAAHIVQTGGALDLSLFLRTSEAGAWASRFLQGYEERGGRVRRILETAGLSARFGTVDAARRSGCTDNTVRARIVRVETMLDVNLDLLGHRVALDLALQIARLADHEESSIPAPTFAQLLAHWVVQYWAEQLLDSLPEDARRIRRTVMAWLATGCDTAAAGNAVGLHRKTVNVHLAAAGAEFGARLLAPYISTPTDGDMNTPMGGLGAIDLALAGLALGELSYEQLGLADVSW